MKIAIKIFNFITIILCVVGAFSMLIMGIITEYTSVYASIGIGMGILIWLILIIPAFINGIANSKLDEATSPKELILIGIIILLMGNLISGVLLLSLSEKDFNIEAKNKKKK